MKFKFQFYGLGIKIKNARKHCFRFSEIVKLTSKIYSSISNINICYYLKLPIPKMHGDFLKLLPQNPENVKSVCNDRNSPFHFACRR